MTKTVKTVKTGNADAIANAALQFLQLTGVRAAVQTAALVASCYDNPSKAFEAHKDFFIAHNVSEPYDELYESVLFEALHEQKLTRSVDWKEYPQEVIGQVQDLLAPNERVVLAAYYDDVGEDVYPDAALRECSKLLTESLGKRILVWDFGADEYTFFIIPTVHTAAILQCAAVLAVTLELPEQDKSPDEANNIAVPSNKLSSEGEEEATVAEGEENSTKTKFTGCLLLAGILFAVCYAGASVLGWVVGFVGRFLP